MQGLDQQQPFTSYCLDQLQEDTKPKDKPLYFMPLGGENLRSDTEQNEKMYTLCLASKWEEGRQEEAV